MFPEILAAGIAKALGCLVRTGVEMNELIIFAFLSQIKS
jgi:hypothetical protein